MNTPRRSRSFISIVRSVLLIVALIGGDFLVPTTVHAAATYYVDATSGNDANTGTSTTAAWKTISKVNTFLASASHVAGDTILFKRGDTFYAPAGASGITLTKNGTSAARITLGAYGSGAKPVISGFTPITSGWTSVGTNLWEIAAPTNVNNMSTMMMNGTVMPLGRYPKLGSNSDGGYIDMTYSSADANVKFTGPTGTISTLGNLAGAEVVSRTNHWTVARGVIASTSGETVTLANRMSTYNLATGIGFFIQNSPNVLTQNGEWAYIAATGKIRLYYAGTPPTTYFSSVDKLINLVGFDYVTISNLTLDGAKYNAIDGNGAAFITVEGNDIPRSGQFAAYFNGGNDVTITNNTITDSQNSAIYARSTSANNFTISYNTITNTGLRMGTNIINTTSDINMTPINIAANNVKVENNVIQNVGHSGIRFSGNNWSIKQNVIKNFNLELDDGAGIYTYGGGNTVSNPSITQYTNRVITQNVISKAVGAPQGTISNGSQSSGIYLDNNSNNVTITNNTIFDTSNKGIPFNSPQNVTVTGNTFFNTPNGGLGICRNINDGSSVNGGQDPLGSTFTDNIIFNIASDQDSINLCDFGIREANPTNTTTYPDKLSAPTQTLKSRLSVIADTAKGGFNNIYRTLNPVPVAIGAADTTSNPWITRLPMSIDIWKKFSGNDAGSTVIPSPSYTVNGTLATLLDTPVDTLTGITSSGTTSSLSLDTTGQVTGANSAKITVITAPSASQYHYKAYTVWFGLNAPITSIKKYLVKFKTRGTTENGLVKVSLYRKSGTWAYLTPSQYSSFGTDVTQHEFMFTGATASGTGVNGSVLIEVLEASGTTYIDDVVVTDADATTFDPNANVVFEANETAAAKVVSIPAGIYYNVRDTTQTSPIVGSVTVPAYGSVVLVKPVPTNDAIVPTVSLIAPAATSTISGVATLTATASDNVGVSKVEFYQGTTLVATSIASPYTTTWNTAAVANGSYVLKAVATDTSGNVATSSLVTVTVNNADTTPPTVSLTAPTAGTTITSGTATLSATAADNIGVANVDFYYNTTLIGSDTTAPYSLAWTTSALPNGSYVLTAKASDAAGNTTTSSTINVTVTNADTTPPTVSISSPAASSSLMNTVTISANAADNIAVGSVAFYYGTTLIGTDSTSPYTATWNTALVANGSYTLKAVATDTSNNTTTSSLVSVTVNNADSVAPVVTLTSPSAGTVSGPITLSATASDNVGVARVEFYAGTTLMGSDTTAPYSVTWTTTNSPNVNFTVKAIAYDAAGNSTTSNTVVVTVSNIVADTTAPSVSLTSPSAGTVSGTITLSATATDNIGVSRVDFYAGTTLLGSDTTAPYSTSWNTVVSANTSFSVKAIAYDAAGNSGSSSTITVVVSNAVGSSTVAITSPVTGTTISGTVAIMATATGTNITKVEFYKDSDTSPFATTASSYTTFLDTTTLTNGTHTFKAVAYSSSGATSTSPVVTVTVSNAGSTPTPTAGTPSAPSSVVAQAGYTKARIGWTAPSSNGGSAITSYTVTASPGGNVVNSTSSSVVMSTLSNGTAYTFSVRANNSAGAGTALSSNAVTPSATFANGSQVVVVVSSKLAVRQTPGGTRIGTVNNGSIGTVLSSDSSGWTRVQFSGITGWVSSSYIFSN